MRLRNFLQKERLTTAEFAQQIGGVTGEAVRLWAAGLRMPHPLAIEKIVNVTHGQVTVQDLHEQRVERLRRV